MSVDFLGNEIKVGDEVCFIDRNYKQFHRGIIDSISPQKVTIKCDSIYKGKTTRYKDQIIKVNK